MLRYLFLGFLMFAASPAFAQATTGSLRVVIVDDDMALPIPGVELELATAEFRMKAIEKETDQNGEALFEALQPGKYQMVVTRSGFKGATIADIRIKAGKETYIGPERKHKVPAE